MKKICFLFIIWHFISVSVYAYGVDDVMDGDMQDNIINSFEASGVELDAPEVIDRLNKGDFSVGIENIWSNIKDNFANLFTFKRGKMAL